MVGAYIIRRLKKKNLSRLNPPLKLDMQYYYAKYTFKLNPE
jgi:hypothetical protein